MAHLVQPALAESLSSIWSALHAEADFAVRGGDLHYLTGIALAIDDDLLSHLLLKKLRLAEVHEPPVPANAFVTMNSFVEYRFDGRMRQVGQLVHPSAAQPVRGLSIASREGAGIIGLRTGQTILWPNRDGRLADLQVVRIEHRCRSAGGEAAGDSKGAAHG